MAEITVTGEVTRVFYDGKGLSIVDSYQTRTGEMAKNYYTAWLDADRGIKEGQRLTVRGIPAAKIDTYTDKAGVEQQKAVIHINRVAILNTADKGETLYVKDSLNLQEEDLPF